ncbi:MAG: RNA recognition motif domain-containing protein [Cytophagaceae bacterium]
MNIYIGNISSRLNEQHIRQLFEGFGMVEKVRLIKDFNTGDSKGMAFVEMPYEAEGKSAIENLNRIDLDGKKMVVSLAKETTGKPTKSFNKTKSGRKKF